MNKPFLKTTLAFAVFTAMTVSVQAQDQVTEEKEGVVPQSETTKLQTIVVTATGYEQDLAKAPASITVIDREELDKREYNDITDVLRNTCLGSVVSGSGFCTDHQYSWHEFKLTPCFWSMVSVNMARM